MDQQRLTELMRIKSAEVPGQTRFCPEDTVIANYFQGALSGPTGDKLRHHLADCRFCQARVGNLERLGDEYAANGVAETVLADAKHLARRAAPRPGRHLPVWATAAVVVLAVLSIIMYERQLENAPGMVAPDVQHEPEATHQMRSIEPVSIKPEIISPADGDSIETSGMTVRWTEVKGTLHYDVLVVTVEGFIVWNDRVEGTKWRPPTDSQLEPGMDYFVRVDAYLAEANIVSSEHILFTVEEHRE